MTKFIAVLWGITLSALTSCAKEQISNEEDSVTSGVEMTFSARGESGEKTVLSGFEVHWNKDAISIFDGSANNRFTTASSGTSTASFTGTAAESPVYYAVCPYFSGAISDGNSKSKNFNFFYDSVLVIYNHPFQKPVALSYDPLVFTSVARSDSSKTLQMKNLSGLVKFAVETSDIAEIEFRGNNNEQISGTFFVSIAENGTPSIGSCGYLLGMQSVTLKPSEGETFAPGVYYMVLPPTEFSKGFTIKLKNAAGKVAVRGSENALTVERSSIVNIGTIDIAGLVWNECLELEFLKYCRQGAFTPPGLSAKESRPWPFTSPAASKFPSSMGTVSGISLVRTLALTKAKDSCYIYSNKFSPHPLYGFRMQGTTGKPSYIEVPGKAGKRICRVELVDNNKAKLTDVNGSSLVGGDAPAVSPGNSGETVWYPTVEAGAGLRIVSQSLNVWRVRVYYTDVEDPEKKNATKILCIGNSFNRDAIYHLPLMMKNAGIDDISITFAYRQGSPMSYHSDWTNNGYTLFESAAGSGKWTTITGYYASDKAPLTLWEVCKRDSWDIVTLHEFTGNSAAWEWNETEKGYFDTVFAHLDTTLAKTPDYYYILTHAFYDMDGLKGAQGSQWGQHETAKMFNVCAATARSIVEAYPDRFKGVISTGAAVENLRTTELMNDEYGLSRDGYHLDYGVARCAAACTFFETVITPLRKINLDNNNFTYDCTQHTDTLYRTPVTSDNFPVCLQSARDAIAHPYEITAQ